MKGTQVVLGEISGARAAALVVDGVLTDLRVDPGALVPYPPGAILRGVVDRLVKGQGGVFVRLPEGETGYLRDRHGLREGQPLLVEVSGVAEEGKAVPLTSRLLLRGRTAIVSPGAPGINVSRRLRDPDLREALTAAGSRALAGLPEDIGLILRSAAEAAPLAEVEAQAAELAALAMQLRADLDGPPELLIDAPDPWTAAGIDWAGEAVDEVLDGPRAFADAGILEALDALSQPTVALKSGGSAVIEPTRALVAIDVNTGRDTSPAAGLKANIDLARDLPRQLRLRGLSGQVVIDFAPITKRDRGTLDQVMKAAFKAEGAETTLSGWTAMGLYEMTRKRDRVPLARLLAALA